MIKASQAYKESFDTKNINIEAKILEIDGKIRKAIKDKPGTTSIFFYEPLNALVVKQLEENGYKVTGYTDPRNEYTGTVSWDVADKA